MSDTGKDANPLAQASEKVENVASDAAQAAKEKAAQMQPGGSQVGDVRSSCDRTPRHATLQSTYLRAHVMQRRKPFRHKMYSVSIMQVVQEKSDGSEKKAEKP
jgi:hypothetical protein